MNRILLVVIFGGGFLVWTGWKEFRLGQVAGHEPQQTDLVTIEAGERLENAHVVIPETTAAYFASVFEFKTGRGEGNREARPTDKVTVTYVPLVSDNHPFLRDLFAKAQLHDGFENIPDEEIPDFTDFAVLLKTKRFATVADIPDGLDDIDDIQGVFVNEIEPLSGEELALYQGAYPGVDFSRVLILEEGRTPTGVLGGVGMMVGGTVVSLLGVAFLLRGPLGLRKKSSPTELQNLPS